ncbi:J domain-containing protein [Chromobacterium violaceum]|uniref:J domain-containing protein n=1 Tax=Chromobacterium violaceum TaxID=536 RepID=UPI0009DABF3C|nr:J domain-containing protein [Chromobacterium violaceum]OQS20733.1 hypothetical protein B0T41_21565 [Chromobacterium violaceum]
MISFLSKLFRTKKEPTAQESVGQRTLVSDSKRTSGRREPPAELDLSRAEYIPLPPSPPTWEVDGREEFHREYNDPLIGPVFQAGFKNQHTKVVKLSASLSPDQRQGRVGEVIAKAYSKLIIQRIKSGQMAAAAKQCIEMFERVPNYVEDVDRRRFNRVLAQMDKAGKRHDYTPVDVSSSSQLPLFSMSDDAPWTLVGELKLQSDERPNAAFDIAAIDPTGIWLLDRSGSSMDPPEAGGVLRRMDRHGFFVGEKALRHDVYLTGASANGSSIAIMDFSGVLHVYDAQLNAIIESNLREDPRVVDHFRTINTNYWGEFKSQVRAVDVAPEGDRYLFTLADEAWCCTTSGRRLWGIVMPLNEGWKRVVRRSESFGASQEVEDALRLFGLSLPINPSDIKQKYRKLAFTHHPDLNAGDPAATEKMKALNKAFEILTGVDPTTLGFEESDVTYFARTGPDHVMEVEGLRVEITITGGTPQDWVYAASFAADGGAYLATYSGKVILVSHEGRPEVVYDIGTCPSRIVSVGSYTYFLTPTRLYVIKDKVKLVAFLDVFKQGRLIVSQSGFGLLTGKQLQWFTEEGKRVGELATRDPIRVIHAIDGGAIVQTRQHQIEVRGLVI